MINDLFVPIRRVSVRTRRLMWIAVACGSAYYLSVLQQSMPLPVLHGGDCGACGSACESHIVLHGLRAFRRVRTGASEPAR